MTEPDPEGRAAFAALPRDVHETDDDLLPALYEQVEPPDSDDMDEFMRALYEADDLKAMALHEDGEVLVPNEAPPVVWLDAEEPWTAHIGGGRL